MMMSTHPPHCARLAAIGGLIQAQYQPVSRTLGHLRHINLFGGGIVNRKIQHYVLYSHFSL